MRNILLSLALMLCPFKITAASDNVNAILLHVSSGQNWTILLDEQPVVTFSDDYLIVTTHLSVISIPSSLVTKFTYVHEDDETRINNASLYGSVLSFDGKNLSVRNLVPSISVQVYTSDGALVTSGTTDNRGNVSLSVPDIEGALYMVKTSTVTFKIRKP